MFVLYTNQIGFVNRFFENFYYIFYSTRKTALVRGFSNPLSVIPDYIRLNFLQEIVLTKNNRNTEKNIYHRYTRYFLR